MSNLRRVLIVSLTLLLFGPSHFGDSLIADEVKSRGRALLIGCTKYDHLDSSLHLQGPGNDVLLMRDLLCTRFGFTAERVVILAESVGQAESRPTRANIEREFRRLGREAVAGEQVLIFLAGHGSQQPDLNPSADDPEPDGLDEIFLPADVKGWDGSIGQVPNAIVDDEFRVWLAEIEQRQAAVTVIMDACHSGTMTRGVDERVRELPPGVLVPTEVMRKAQAQAVRDNTVTTREKSRGGRTPEVGFDATSVVAIYAAQSSEVTVEKLLPAEGQDRKPYGLLTYTMNQILIRSTRPMTYRELVRQIQTQYVGAGRTFPTPMIEGKDRDREVLGLSVLPDRARIKLTKTARGWTINAGVLQGISQDSILSVFAAADDTKQDATKPLGHVRVQLARTVDAEVVPCEFDDRPAVKDLPDGAPCELAYVDAGDLRLRFAISPNGAATNATWVQRLKTELQLDSMVGKPLRLVRLVEKESEADWIVSVREQDVILVPAESGASATDAKPQAAFGPKPLGPATAEWVGSALERIARATNLKKLAARESEETPRGEEIRIELSVERMGASPQASPSERLTLRDGDQMTIRMKNPCRFPVDVTLLTIDTAYGIQALFPEQGEINRLQPGDSVPFTAEVVAESRGLEHVVAIAVKADGEVVDFTSLTQPSLEKVRTRGGAGNRSLESPLGELLKHAVFAEGKTRGVKRTAVKAHRLQLLTWEVEPKGN